MNIAEALKFGAAKLREASVDEPEREANHLLRLATKRDAAFIYANPEHRLDAVESIMFKAVVKRRAAREPFQHISGFQEFYGLQFQVTPDVLIPRPETEILVEAAINELKDLKSSRFLEIGVGSGCISVAVLKNVPNAKAWGVDVSEKALEMASRNAIDLEVSKRIDLHLSNVFSQVSENAFDLIVSNPPYVPEVEIETLQEEVRKFEPLIALSGGEDGLEIIRTIAARAPQHLRPKGLLLMEIGWKQSESVATFFEDSLWTDVEFLPDLQSIPRILKARLRS